MGGCPVLPVVRLGVPVRGMMGREGLFTFFGWGAVRLLRPVGTDGMSSSVVVGVVALGW